MMKSIQLMFVLMLTIGFMSCKSKSNAVETSSAQKVETKNEVAENYGVDLAASKVLWEGTKMTGKHDGDVKLSAGNIQMGKKGLVGGSFTIDMNTINCTDLEGGKKAYLETHLKGTGDDGQDDFFNVTKYPTASFEITKATRLMNNPDGNYVINGNLKIRDISKSISFKANVQQSGNAITVTTPQFKINRTEWGITYKSTSLGNILKDKAIDDDMGIQINLSARK